MVKHDKCFNLAQEWIGWLDSKRFFGRPKQKNILAMLQHIRERSMIDPDAPLSAEMSAFNLCVKAQEDDHLIPFLFVYCRAGDKPAKYYAYYLNIATPNFYLRAHKTASDIYRGHLNLLDLHHALQLEVRDYV